MKVDKLKQYIREIVRSEIKSVLKEELGNHVLGVLADRSVPNPVAVQPVDTGTWDPPLMTTGTSNSDHPQVSSGVTTVVAESVAPPVKKKFVTYTKNKLLNQVLNETTGGIPSDGALVSGMIAPAAEIDVESLPENVQPVAKALTRDYSEVMAAIYKKKGA
jgi:hypothetical protein